MVTICGLNSNFQLIYLMVRIEIEQSTKLKIVKSPQLMGITLKLLEVIFCVTWP